LVLTVSSAAQADKEPQNLKVFKKDTDKKVLDKAMKELSKGLGVKCAACHVKGKFESDDIKAKVATRDFFTAVVGEADAGKRDAALKALLPALELSTATSADVIWAGL
jgi:hypothetical protein